MSLNIELTCAADGLKVVNHPEINDCAIKL